MLVEGGAEMRVVVILLALLIVATGLVPGESDARRHKADRQRTIVVQDYTSAAWAGVVTQTVDDFNAVMPKRGPRLRYVREDGACPDTRPKRSMLVCSVANDPRAGYASPWGRYVFVNDTYAVGWHAQFRAQTVCHEFMHALSGVGDNRTFGPDGNAIYPLPDQSCVWGDLSAPGPFDIALLAELYGSKRR